MTDGLDELAVRLFAIDTGSSSTGAITARIAREITQWALAHGWHVRPEARVDVPTRPSRLSARPQTGYIDVIVLRDGRQPDFAIEIDSADKPWSLAKLRHAAAAGMHSIWIRWGDDEWAGYYDDVDVIQLSVLRRSAPSPASRQLVLWAEPETWRGRGRGPFHGE
jgi:hypothetical protein